MRVTAAEYRHLFPAPKAKEKRKRPEDAVQIAVLDFLRTELPNALVFHVPNGEWRAYSTQKRLKELGVLRGVSDLCVLFPEGVTVFLEVKAPKGSATKEQREFLAWLKENDHLGRVVRSVDDVKTALIEWGFLKGEKNA
jgi:hypothetical protein